MDDQQLLASLAGPQRDAALAECIRRFGPMVKRAAWRITGDEHRADDVCQAVFLVLIRKATGLASVQSLGAWLYHVAVLTSRNVVKSEARRQRHEQGAGMAQAQRDMPGKLPTGIDEAINGLPEIYRRVLVAHYLEGRSHAEVAAQLGINEDTARKRASLGIHRVRRALGRTVAGVSVAGLASLLAAEAAAAQVATLSAAQVAAIQTAAVGTASAQVAGLAAAATKALLWAKLKAWTLALTAAVALVVPAYVLLKPDHGLVGHYTFAEGAGTMARDASPSGNHGTLVGGVTWAAGHKPDSKALRFDGKTGCVKFGTDLSNWLGGTATVAFWIQTTQQGIKNDSLCLTGVDVAGGDVALNSNDVQWGYLDEQGRIGVCAGDPEYGKRKKRFQDIIALSTQPISDGQWHHVALTRNAALGHLEVYVDGQLSSATRTGAIGLKTTPFFSIGRKEVVPEGAKPAPYFQSLLSDVRFYDRVLPAAEIETLAKR